MKKMKLIISLFVVICLTVIMLCVTASADETEISFVANGCSGGTISLNTGTVTTAISSDTSIATVAVDGGKAVVSRTDNAVGTVTITINNSYKVDVAVGYTTFVFNGNKVTVYEGEDTKYEISGINMDGNEYKSDGDTYILGEPDDSGEGKVWSNTDKYSLCINIKKKGGTYVFTGSSEDMCIAVNNEAEKPAVLLMEGVNLKSSLTSPLTIKKDSTSSVTVTALQGFVNTLADSEYNNADTYGETDDGGDGTNAEYAESAVIKAKAGSTITLNGKGTLNLNCCTKNAVKTGEGSNLTIEDLNLNINSEGHGISSDNVLTVKSGTIYVKSNGDGIRSDPDTDDTNSSGTLNFKGGNITVESDADCIQSAENINISGGTFNLKSTEGKGIKSSPSDDVEDTSTLTNTILITDGKFTINTVDDAVHSDAYITINAGEFDITTSDDAIHADKLLTVGTENGCDRDLIIDIKSCYEGLESTAVTIYSGIYKIISSDDGINAAENSENEVKPGPGVKPTASSNCSINLYGGKVYVNAGGDGLDSNGNINLNGGNLTVFGQEAKKANAPLDCDGTMKINGATVFAAGSSSMSKSPASSSQYYITSKTSYSKNSVIAVKNGNDVVLSIRAPKNINYVLYSSPEMTSYTGWTITTTNTAPLCEEGHTWDSGVMTKAASAYTAGIRTYTCTVCGAKETKSIPCTGEGAEKFLCITDDETCDVYLDYSEKNVSEGTYVVILAFYDDKGKMGFAVPFTVNVENNKYVSLSTTFNSAYKNCYAFLVDKETYAPKTESVNVKVI